jgi:hypothetical protein
MIVINVFIIINNEGKKYKVKRKQCIKKVSKEVKKKEGKT